MKIIINIEDAFFDLINYLKYCYNLLKEKIFKFNEHENIDIVFLWVDGDDPAHKYKKDIYLNKQASHQPVEAKAIKKYRWTNNDELIIALKSVQKFCPWVAKIWIVTDNQIPRIDSFSEEFRAKIAIVDHKDIFYGYESFLPTFNSRTIETFLWRIKGLSEKFIYFNDDMFLLKHVSKNDFFISNKPVLRGYYKKNCDTELSLHRQGILNGALILGFKKIFFFKQDHTSYVLIKSHLEILFSTYKDKFEKNIIYKFRSRDQFLTVSLFYHKCILDNNCLINYKKDYIHISEAVCKNYSRDQLMMILEKASNKKYKFICINDLEALQTKVPDFKNFLPSELFD